MLEANLAAAKAQLEWFRTTRFVLRDTDWLTNIERIDGALDRTPQEIRADLMTEGPAWEDQLVVTRRYWQSYIQAVVDDLAALDTPPEPPPPPA